MAQKARPRTKAPWEQKAHLYESGEHLKHIENDPQLQKVVSAISSVRLSDSGERNLEKALNIWRKNIVIYNAWNERYRTELEICVTKFPSTKKLLGPCIRLLEKRYKNYIKKFDSILSKPIKTDIQAKRLLNGARWRRFRLLKKELRLAIFNSKHCADEMGLLPLATLNDTDEIEDKADGNEHANLVIEQTLKRALTLIQGEDWRSDTERKVAEKIVARLRALLPPQEQFDKTKAKNPKLKISFDKPNCANTKDMQLRVLESKPDNMESDHGVSENDAVIQQQRQKPLTTQQQQPEFAPKPTQTTLQPAQPQQGPKHSQSESVHQQPEAMHSHSVLTRPHPLKPRSKPTKSSPAQSILRDTTNKLSQSKFQRSNFHTRVADQLVSYDTLKKRTVEMISNDSAIGELGEGSSRNTTHTHNPEPGESSKSGGAQNIANGQKPTLEGKSSKSREKQVNGGLQNTQMERSSSSMERNSPESQSVDLVNAKTKPKATFHSDNRQYVLDIKEEFRQYALMDGPAREKAAKEARLKAFAEKEAGRREDELIRNAPDPPEPAPKDLLAKALDKLPHIRIG